MVSCEQHDYIEIACLYEMGVVLVMRSGEEIVGRAKNTGWNAIKEECLLLQCAVSAGEIEEKWIVLKDVFSMQAQIENPYFTIVEF